MICFKKVISADEMTVYKKSIELNELIQHVGETLKLMGYPHKMIVAILSTLFKFDFGRLKEGEELALLIASNDSVDASINTAERHRVFRNEKLVQLPLNIVKGSSLSIWKMT